MCYSAGTSHPASQGANPIGDRANTLIITGVNVPPVVVYSHSSGSYMPKIVAHAIKAAKPRWNDESYCSRIIIHQILDTITEADTEYGAGITVAPNIIMGEYPEIVIDVPSNQVWQIPNFQARSGDWALADPSAAIPFAEATTAALKAQRKAIDANQA